MNRSFFKLIFLLCSGIALPSAQAQEAGAEVESVASTAPVSINTTESTETQDPQEEVLPPTPQQFSLPSDQHEWTKFSPGAWREIQITTETFDPEGNVINRSVTTQKEILKDFDDETYTLEVQATVDLVGKRIVGDWKTRVLHQLTDSPGELLETIQLDDAKLTIDGIERECQVWQIRFIEDGGEMLDQLYYHPQLFPNVLQRDSSKSDDQQEDTEIFDTTKTIASRVPYVVDEKIINCTSQQTLRKRQKGNSTQITFLSSEIPGGEAASWTSDYDSQGKINRWSTLKLIGYGFSTTEP